ncbi:MAG: hypothetical protein V4485_03495 [Pseudomonadota bacterium]
MAGKQDKEEMMQAAINVEAQLGRKEKGGTVDDDYSVVDSVKWEDRGSAPKNDDGKSINSLYNSEFVLIIKHDGDTQLQLLTIEEDDYIHSRWVDTAYFEQEPYLKNGKFSKNEIKDEVVRLLKEKNLNSIAKNDLKSSALKFLKIEEEPSRATQPIAKPTATPVAPPKREQEEKQRGRLKLSDIPAVVKEFMPISQQRAIVGSTEHWEVIDRLKGIIENMPKSYETDNIKQADKIVYLHYFVGNSDWYIVEKDAEPEQIQAYGYAILNGDTQNAEMGYINISELRKITKWPFNLDFFFTPTKLGEIITKKTPRTSLSDKPLANNLFPANPKLNSVTIDWAETIKGVPRSFDSFKAMTNYISKNMELPLEGYDKADISVDWKEIKTPLL